MCEMRTKTVGLLVVLLLVLGGCSDNPMGSEDFLPALHIIPLPNIDGDWSSSLGGYSLFVNLSETKGTVITGNATFMGRELQVSGTRVGAELTLDFISALPIVPFVFSGCIVDKNTITGSVNGLGFENEYLSFTRD